MNLANFELRWSVTQASVGVLYQRKKPMFIEKGENIDQYFCNEDMASANRSHPVADGGKCLALKTLLANAKSSIAFSISPCLSTKVLLIGVRSI